MRIYLTTLFAIMVGFINAQNFKDIFLGDDYLMYKGSLLILNENSIGGFSHSFYGELSNALAFHNDNVLFPDAEIMFTSAKDSLKGRVLLVEDILDKEGKSSLDAYYFDKLIFLLRDTSTNKPIYFIYDRKGKGHFPFLVSGIIVDKKELCSRIETSEDEFTGNITINNPIDERKKISPLVLYKEVINNKTYYYLSLRTYGTTISVAKVGAIILFDDGTKLNKPSVKIDVDVSYESQGYQYSAYTLLSAADINMLCNKKVSKFRLYVYDEEINPWFAEKFTYYVKCIMGKE